MCESLFQLDSGLSSESLRELICKSDSELTHSVRLDFLKALTAPQKECDVLFTKGIWLLIMNYILYLQNMCAFHAYLFAI